jgi:hypothetical protein
VAHLGIKGTFERFAHGSIELKVQALQILLVQFARTLVEHLQIFARQISVGSATSATRSNDAQRQVVAADGNLHTSKNM